MTDSAPSPPLPVVTPLTSFFWEGTRAHELRILRCRDCGRFVHYPRPICDGCQSESLAPERVSGRGTLYSYTVTSRAYHPYWVDKVPYVLATVELDEQPALRMPTNVIDCDPEALEIGMPLEVVFRPLTDEFTLPFFRPLGGA